MCEAHGFRGDDVQNVKIVLFSLILFLSARAHADWRAVFERAGFFGKYSLGASYEWQPEHAVDLSLGVYQIEGQDYYQTNLVYRYSRWNVPFFGHMWRPLQFGAFFVYSLDRDRYFLDSPSKYPYKGYYDETALRWGAEFSSTLTFYPSRFAVAMRLRIFDNGLIAIYNNSQRDIQYYVSSGISLQYLF